ncbi:MAG TPA: nucleotidyl transferase AbiEii/AbiGii toxin family protein [Trueperaceae bacterium]|nr:nucleotidyl transferase AbiEii/AbiGii toxin family protein [Trueperaceae bacterium]
MRYRDAASFRQGLEQRLNTTYRGQPALLARARKVVAFERLLARMVAVNADSWLLKGGFALELRLNDRARSTKDIDIAWLAEKEELLDALLDAAQFDAGDHFNFQMERDSAPEDRFGGSHRFRVKAELAGRTFDRFVVDCGFDNTAYEGADTLVSGNLLEFAQIQPTKIKAIPLERHLAEKIHAYTRTLPVGRPNTRVKDLVDMVLIAESFNLDGDSLSHSIVATFHGRDLHPVPERLPTPPREWSTPYGRLAGDVGISPEISAGHVLAAALIDPILQGSAVNDRWDPVMAMWTTKWL